MLEYLKICESLLLCSDYYIFIIITAVFKTIITQHGVIMILCFRLRLFWFLEKLITPLLYILVYSTIL